MSDNPYKAPETAEAPEQPRASRPLNVSMVFWVLIALLGLISTMGWLLGPTPPPVLAITICVSIMLLGIAGVRLNWGPVILCMIIGGIVVMFFMSAATPISVFLGLLLTGILAGGACGYFGTLAERTLRKR